MKSTFQHVDPVVTLSEMHRLAGQDGTPAGSLRALRDDPGVDQTFQNVLRALTLSLELRSRYRVFEFEATQDGHPETASLFRSLRAVQDEQIERLMAGLHARMDSMGVGDATA